jgi:diguanylate cyclase (GGDEF)-like protein
VVSALHTLNACDAIVVRSRTEQALIQDLCRTIVDEEGYRLSWIGFASDRQHQDMNIQAWAGDATDFIPELEAAWAASPSLQGSVAATLRSGKTQIITDIARGMAPSRARDSALKHGLKAAITLPLLPETGPSGCLAIYSDTVDQFGEEERQLLTRLSDNLVFGINALRAHQERDQHASKIHDMAFSDALTGLPNRRHLVNHLDGVLNNPGDRQSSGAVMFIDLDGFKLINDALGHESGDQVLRQIAHRLQNTVRDGDLVVRHGGDEFLVVMVNDPRQECDDQEARFQEGVHQLAQRIINHIQDPLQLDGHEHHLNASVGISLYPEHGRDANSLIENADKAMYEAKRSGGGRSHLFTADISDRWQRRLSLEARLYAALEQDAFALHYQPIFELKSLQVMAVEALIRWPQEDGSVMMPGSFMPVVEETSLIRPIGDWVLETAARQHHDLWAQGFKLDMSLNLSPRQIGNSVTANHFTNLVLPHTDPARIQLEVTENTLMTEVAKMEILLRELREAGFQLAVDDFGTGYSSLSRLHTLPIQTLKIDRSFVAELDRPDSRTDALVTTMQQLARRGLLGTAALSETLSRVDSAGGAGTRPWVETGMSLLRRIRESPSNPPTPNRSPLFREDP